MADLGYRNDLLILPFDHRTIFQEKLFDIKGRTPTAEETKNIASYKQVIYDGYKLALTMGVPAQSSGILIDDQFSTAIAEDARAQGYAFAMPAEKTAQEEFHFEHGEQFAAVIEKFKPTMVKVLVRYNPEADGAMNTRQLERLKRLGDYLRETSIKYMFELLTPATKEQLKRCNESVATYDSTMRPELMLTAMKQIHAAGIEPDVWKLEGIETEEDSRRVAALARSGGHRANVGIIVLGRGETTEKVKSWLAVAARTPGVIGFAVGRTVFWDPIKDFKNGTITRAEAVHRIATSYADFCNHWLAAKRV